MTIPGRGPSLLQARDDSNEDPLGATYAATLDHYKLHAPQHLEAPIANHDHNTHHARSPLQRHNRNTKTNPKKRQPTDPNARLPYRRRQDTSAAAASDGTVTEIVQTVNVVQVIDSAGATVDVQTQYSSPHTIVIDASTGTTILDSSAPQSANVEVSSASALQAETVPTQSPTSSPGSSSDGSATDNRGSGEIPATGVTSSTTSEAVGAPASETSESAYTIAAVSIEASLGVAESTSTTGTLASLTSSVPVTTAHTSFPVFSSVSNSSLTLEAATHNSTARLTLLAVNSTSSSTTTSSTDSSSTSSFTSPFTNSSTSSSTSSSASSSSSTSSSSSSSSTQTTTLYSTTASDFAGAGFGGVGATATAASGSGTDSAASTTSSNGNVDTKTVVGGVFGGIAAAALLLAIVLLILRRRKRYGGGGKGFNLLGGAGPKDNGPTSNRGLLDPGPSAPMSQADTQSKRMTQRGSLSFFIPSSLAALTGGKRDSTSPEQGFVRVSGKKLPSVLTHGGDGFSDPRESMLSGTGSSFYRDSYGFSGDPGGLAPNQRLALGTPMRPESGIVVMRSGPGRTPVREENPFADPEPNPFTDPGRGLSPPRPPLARSLTGSASGHSRGSGSRFTEDI